MAREKTVSVSAGKRNKSTEAFRVQGKDRFVVNQGKKGIQAIIYLPKGEDIGNLVIKIEEG